MGEIRWGIMGAGAIARRFATALEQVDGARLMAVSGRSASRLASFSSMHPVDESRRYASGWDEGFSAHERLVADPDVDAVYLALPHGMHVEWACRLLRAGKAVLCEKPAVLTEHEALRIAGVARETGTLFMEAMKPRFMPARDQVKALIARGDLGGITSLDIAHRVDYGDQTGRYLLDPVQGGTLYDLGCYGVGWMEDLLGGLLAGEDPVDGSPVKDALDARAIEVRAARPRWMPSSDGTPIDIADDVHLSVRGVPVHLDFAGDADHFEAVCRIRCERGTVEVPLLHRPVSYIVTRDPGAFDRGGAGVPDAGPSTPGLIDAPAAVDDFYGEVEHFCGLMRAGLTESPVMPLTSTIRLARIIDAIRASWPATDGDGR